MKVVVIGSSGTIGKGVVQALKDSGHEVIEASRSTNPAINIDDPSSIDKFYEGIGQVDAIVSAAGNAAMAALDSLTDEQLQLCVKSKLLGQVNLVRKGLKNLKAGGVFIITGGTLAYSPLPQTSAIAMVNAGLEGFARAAALDLTEGRRIVTIHPPWLAETAMKIGMDYSKLPDSATVGQTYLKALNGNMSGRPVFVDGYEPAR